MEGDAELLAVAARNLVVAPSRYPLPLLAIMKSGCVSNDDYLMLMRLLRRFAPTLSS